MLAVGLDASKNIAIAVVIGFVVLALVAASAIKNVTYKIVVTLVLAGFALGVWTQRSNLDDCADRDGQLRSTASVRRVDPASGDRELEEPRPLHLVHTRVDIDTLHHDLLD